MKGRTVTKLLTEEEAEIYMQWIENRRELEATVKKMLRLSRAVAVLVLKKGAFIPGR